MISLVQGNGISLSGNYDYQSEAVKSVSKDNASAEVEVKTSQVEEANTVTSSQGDKLTISDEARAKLRSAESSTNNSTDASTKKVAQLEGYSTAELRELFHEGVIAQYQFDEQIKERRREELTANQQAMVNFVV